MVIAIPSAQKASAPTPIDRRGGADVLRHVDAVHENAEARGQQRQDDADDDR